MAAVAQEDYGIVSALISAGADVDIRDSKVHFFFRYDAN